MSAVHSNHKVTPPNQQHSLSRLALLVGLLVSLLLAIVFTTGPSTVGSSGVPRGQPELTTLSVLIVFVLSFASLAMNWLDRLTTVMLGALASLLVGSALAFYTPLDAARYVWEKSDTLLLLASMGVVTGALVESGCLARLARTAVRLSRGDRRRLFQLFCALTYTLSLTVNNLTTIMIMIPLSLVVTERMGMDPIPLVLGEVVASNLGGASTMVGDFPNMLLAADLGLPFRDFLTYLAPVCLLQLGILIAYLQRAYPVGESRRRASSETESPEKWDRAMAFRGKLILGGVLVGFIVGGELGVSPVYVAAAGVLWVIAWARLPMSKIVERVGIDNVAFFVCLFIMVGAISAAGTFDSLGHHLKSLLQRSPVVGVITLACAAAVLTAFFNAGPTTALLIHMLLAGAWPAELTLGPANQVVWWALSLGVCAGSSATLTGATAGPIAASILEQQGKELNFRRFAETGIPLMTLFLVVSSLYLTLLIRSTS